MTNEEFLTVLYNNLSILPPPWKDDRAYGHAKKLVAVVEAAKNQKCSSCRGKSIELLQSLKDLEKDEWEK